MVSLSHFLAVLLSLSIFFFFLHKWRRSNSPKPWGRLPPSPSKLPVIGNLHQLSSAPHRSLQSLSRRYGTLMLLIASSAEAAREIMKNQDLIFSSRPQLSIASRLFYNNQDMAFAPYGEHWRQIRSICVLHLLSNKRVQSYRGVREEETSLMVDKIRRLGASSNPVNLSDVIQSLTIDVICRVALGKKYSLGSHFKEIFGEFGELVGILPSWEYIPWLSWMRRFDGLDNRVDRAAKKMDREVAGNKDEIDELPYLKAVIKESLRLHSPGPLLLPRELTQDTRVLGYDVASGTPVMINVWEISRDPSLWKNPEEFRPERFLEMSMDVTGLHFELTPFGAGRRGCPGITFAMVVDELTLAKLVHKFDFGLPNGAKMKELDVSESSGVIIHKKCHLFVVATSHVF
ncbi:hypothetical protein SASPL_131327 [Salvia splendens]|uniref:Uncharacterized protein n=1 Tax=Salvia splendens TaxID=180675 RepID=A0A8X8X8J4_SALSN|nr:hypothetical protein SASPL_131327 [Salvia splendens]